MNNNIFIDKTNEEKQSFIVKLINKALFSSIGKYGGIGYHTKNIKGHELKIMKSLTSNDFNHRIK